MLSTLNVVLVQQTTHDVTFTNANGNTLKAGIWSEIRLVLIGQAFHDLRLMSGC